jgi:hypothetical protein
VTAPIPTTEPTTITPGDTVKWTRTLPDYPADAGWALSYEFVNAAQRYTVTGSASGADHAVTISATTSATYVAGTYDWRARASKAGEVYTVGTGRTTVKASFAAATDARSQMRIALEAIEATLAGRTTSATAEYEIAGRRLKFIPPSELLVLRDRYRMDVAREDAAANTAAGLSNPGRIYVRHI